MYLWKRRKIWTSFSCLVLLKCYHMVFSQFTFSANLAQLVVPKMHCLYANAVVQLSMQHFPCYMAWKTKVYTWCRYYHLCINAPMWRDKKMVARTFWTALVILTGSLTVAKKVCQWHQTAFSSCVHCALTQRWFITFWLYYNNQHLVIVLLFRIVLFSSLRGYYTLSCALSQTYQHLFQKLYMHLIANCPRNSNMTL